MSISTVYGSCLDIDFDFFDSDGNPEDITGDAFGIVSSSPSAFRDAVFIKSDPANGKLHMSLSSEHAHLLGIGNVNWFRLRRILRDGCERNLPPLWINVT